MSDLFENLDYYLQVLHFATELKDSDLKVREPEQVYIYL